MSKRETNAKSLVMYTRQGCCLCDDAARMLEELGQVYALHLRFVDIDTDPELVERFGEKVPVIEMDGKERFWGRINRALVERMLK